MNGIDIMQLLSDMGSSEFTKYIGWGAFLTLVTIWLPSFVLRALGKYRIFHPNAISLWRVPICYFGAYLYCFTQHSFAGFLIVVVGLASDRLDGRMAKLLGLETETGKWLDPLVDKIVITTFVFVATCFGFGWVGLGAMILGFDLLGTTIRPPFGLGQSWVRSSKATGVGKIKLVFYFLYLLSAVAYHRGWYSLHQSEVLNIELAIAAIFGGLSVASRLDFPGRLRFLNQEVDRVTHVFGHKKA